LGISTNSYAKIERGETDVNFSRLKHQLEKANLIIEQQKKEIDYLKYQVYA
jgi:hypothetical protein